MQVWRKITTKFQNASGKAVTKDDPEATKKTTLSKRFYGTLKASSGKTKQIPLTEDRNDSLKLLRRLRRKRVAIGRMGVDILLAQGLPLTERKIESALQLAICKRQLSPIARP